MTKLEAIDPAHLDSVTGGQGWGESIANAWQGTKNFAGGLAAGGLHGPTARIDQVSTFADTSSRATKAGVETGAAINMATGNVGNAVGAVADYFNPTRYK